MKVESLECPNCNAPLDGEIINGRTTCAYCRSVVLIESGGNVVKDVNTGVVIGNAECPKGYTLGGMLNESIQSSVYPLTTLIWCENADQSVKFFRESGKAFQQILKHLLLKHVEGQMESNYTIPMATFMSVEEYLDLNAQNLSNGKKVELLKEFNILPVKAVDVSIPPAVQAEMNCQIEGLSGGIEKEYGKSRTRLYKIGDDYILLSATIRGVKWFVNGMFGGFGNFGDIFGGGLFGKNKNNQQNQNVSQNKSADAVTQSMRTPSEGKPVSFTNWWIPAIYGMKTNKMPDEIMLRDFAVFSNTVTESDFILQRRFEKTDQFVRGMYMARQQEAANVNAHVANVQQDIFRRQNQISQSIQARSNIINSTYQNRVAAQDRMRQGTSEAIRGVDTYVTSSGTTEFKTGAKRVVQKNNDPKQKVEIGYLDSVPNGWTEIFKQ